MVRVGRLFFVSQSYRPTHLPYIPTNSLPAQSFSRKDRANNHPRTAAIGGARLASRLAARCQCGGARERAAPAATLHFTIVGRILFLQPMGNFIIL